MNHRIFAPVRIFALAAAAAIGIAAALSLSGSASAQTVPTPTNAPLVLESSLRYIGISTGTSISIPALTTGSTSSRSFTNVFNAPQWDNADGDHYLFFALPTSEQDIDKVRRTGVVDNDGNRAGYFTLASGAPTTATVNSTSYSIWRTDAAVALSTFEQTTTTVQGREVTALSMEIAIEQISFADGCRTLAVSQVGSQGDPNYVAPAQASGDASLPVCPENDANLEIQPVLASQVINAVYRAANDPDVLTIWTSGPYDQPRWIEDYLFPTDPDGPHYDPSDLSTPIFEYSTVESVEGRGRYITGAGERNDLFIRLRNPDTGAPYTYGELTGVRLHVSPDAYYAQNFANALYSRPSRGANDALGDRGLHRIAHPRLSGKTICNPLTIPSGASGYYVFGAQDVPAGSDDDVPFTYYTATTPVCVIDKDEWKLLTGTTNASSSDPVPDLHLQFSIPDTWADEDNRIWVGAALLSRDGTCDNDEFEAKQCDTAVSTWYQTEPWAYIYRINSFGGRCPVYQARTGDIRDGMGGSIDADVWWQAECELASPTTDALTGGNPIRIGITLLDEADFDSDPALTGDQAARNILRWTEFDSVSLKAVANVLVPGRPAGTNGPGDLGTDDTYAAVSSGQFRFLRPDGSYSEWKQSWDLSQTQLRYEALGTGFFTNSDPRWFDIFPVLEYLPTHEATAQLQVRFHKNNFEIGTADGFVKADNLPAPRPRIDYLSDGRVGVSAFGGVIPAAAATDEDAIPPVYNYPRLTGFAMYSSLQAISVGFTSGSVTAGAQSCTVSGETETCFLDYTRQEAWEAAGGSGTVPLDALIRPIPLLYFPTSTTDEQTISVTLESTKITTNTDGDDVPVVTSLLTGDPLHARPGGGLFVPQPLPPFSYAGITGTLEQDSDDIAAPGTQVPLTIGFQIDAGADAAATTMICTGSTVDPCRFNIDPSNSYLLLSGPALWETGSDRLNIDGNNYRVTCSPNQTIVRTRDFGATCYVVKADGTTRPGVVIASDADEDVTVHASIAARGGGSFIAFVRENDDAPWVPARLRQREFGSYTLKVQQINELDRISLGRKPDANNIVPTNAIPIGTKGTEVRLGLFNENGLPSNLSGVSSITLTSIGGGSLSAYNCSERTSCTLRLTTTADSDRDNNLAKHVEEEPATTGAIDFDFNAPPRAGEVTIRAVVVGRDGSRYIETLTLTISGSAVELAAGGDLPRVHSSATDGDDRDKIEIPITATDANGNPAPLPVAASATVTGIGGASLPAGSHTVAISCNANRYDCKIVVTVTAGASSALAPGAYTATVRGGGLSATEAMFSVSGPVDAITLDIPEDLGQLGNTVAISARAVDKDGIPVADGTWITFASTATRGGAFPAAALATPMPTDHDNDATTDPVRRAKTKNGVAGAVIAIVGNGVSILTATSDNNKSTNAPIDTTDVPAFGQEAISYGSEAVAFGEGEAPATGAIATYRGLNNIMASEVLDLGPPAATVVWLWNGVEWIRYGETDGAEVPGSMDFTVLPGDTILFGSSS